MRPRIRGIDLTHLRPVPSPMLEYDPMRAPYQPANDAAGWIEFVSVASPAAGAQATLRVVPGNTWERLEALRFVLTCSAAVATRTCIVQYIDAVSAGNIYLETEAQSDLTANAIGRMNWAFDIANAGVVRGSRQLNSLPKIILPPGHVIFLAVNSIDANDQISQIRLTLRRWQNRPAWAAAAHG